MAIAALRSPGLRLVQTADHAEVLRLLAKRNQDIGALGTKLVCRLHALIASLAAGGIAKELNASDADGLLGAFEPGSPVEATRHQLALELLEDVRRLDNQLKESHKRIEMAVRASGTSLTEVFGIRSWPAHSSATPGTSPDSTSRDQFAAYNGTAPIEVSSGCSCGPPAVPARQPSAQPRHPHGGHLPDPPDSLGGPCLRREEGGRGQDQEGSDPLPQAPDLQHRLPTPGPRRSAIRAREDKRERLIACVTGSAP